MVAQARGLRTSQTRRFPPPWSVERSDACFIVRDHGGQALAYVYFEEGQGRRAAAHLLTYDEARRIAEVLGEHRHHRLADLSQQPRQLTRATGGRVSTKLGDVRGNPPCLVAREVAAPLRADRARPQNRRRRARARWRRGQ
jgi:hypothetical protein